MIRSGVVTTFLCYSITSIYPIRIYVDTSRKIVDSALELLVADFAGEVSDALFLVELDGYGVLVVAEEAGENGWEGLVSFLALGLLGCLLAFTLSGY